MSKIEKKLYELTRNFLTKPYFTLPAIFFWSILLIVQNNTLRLVVIIVNLVFVFVVKRDMLKKLDELEKKL
jgi:hypothetical protein